MAQCISVIQLYLTTQIFSAHLGLTNFFQHSLAQSTIHIHTMHKADRRTTNDEDDEHGLPHVQPGEITPDGVTWQKQQSPGQVMAGRGDMGPGSSDSRAPDA